MNTNDHITKEYFKEHLDIRFHELRSDIHQLTNSLMKNAEAYYDIESKRHMGALHESFRSDLQGAFDQVKSVTDKTDAHEQRICKIEKAVL